MPRIDPSIIVHKIKTYLDAKSIIQRLRLVHPQKATTIQVEVEKLLKACFIYHVPLIYWVSNLVPIKKKCVDYRDINKS